MWVVVQLQAVGPYGRGVEYRGPAVLWLGAQLPRARSGVVEDVVFSALPENDLVLLEVESDAQRITRPHLPNIGIARHLADSEVSLFGRSRGMRLNEEERYGCFDSFPLLRVKPLVGALEGVGSSNCHGASPRI